MYLKRVKRHIFNICLQFIAFIGVFIFFIIKENRNTFENLFLIAAVILAFRYGKLILEAFIVLQESKKLAKKHKLTLEKIYEIIYESKENMNMYQLEEFIKERNIKNTNEEINNDFLKQFDI